MATDALETEVLIVGAGPVGLALAVELGLRGIACELVEEAAQIGHWWTRAMNMNKRTMEHMRRWGLVDALHAINEVPADWPANVSILDHLGGRQLASVRAEGLGWRRELADAAQDALWIAQGQVQAVLLDKARRLGARIGFGQKATRLELRADGKVQVQVQCGAGVRSIVARYAVGCDGGRSMVRQAVDIPYEGAGALSRQVSIFFRAPQLLDDMRRRGVSDSVMYFCSDPSVPGTARLNSGDRWEFTYRPPPDFDEAGLDAAAIVRTVLGPRIDFTLERSYPFSYFELIASRLREGPVFLAGDAAHMIPPLGGHNLNLGFGDAVNLGWKLAHVLRGWADPGILDSYGPERLPMVRRTAAEAHANFHRLRSTFERLAQMMELPGDDAGTAARREHMGRAIARDLEPQWQSDGTVLDLRYADSPIVDRQDGAAPAYQSVRYQPHAAPGHRSPMWRNADGVPLYDRLGPEYTVLNLAGDPAPGAALGQALCERQLPARHLHLPQPSLRALYGAGLVVVRPDQHVAWRGNALPPAPDRLARLLRGQRSNASGVAP